MNFQTSGMWLRLPLFLRVWVFLRVSDPAKFRAISLLSVLSKLLETHVKNILLEHFDLCAPLSDLQWGFTSGKSTTGALLAATDHWHQALDSGKEVCTVCFDYSKAFDSVPQRPLLAKLRAVNVVLLDSFLFVQ